MRVIRARVLGFCMGVRRAVEMAEAELACSGARKGGVCTMGPLIHNPGVLSSLGDRGLRVLEEGALPPDLEGSTVIIRAHGVSPGLEEDLRRRHAVLVDATCPRVKKNQLRARSLSEAGFVLFIAGEQEHGEVAGLKGYAPRALAVADSAAAARAAETLFRENPRARTALIGQTTIGEGEYSAMAAAIRARFPGLTVVDSICPATRERQEALRELCSRVEAVVIAGGRSSSNTRRLLDIASLAKPAWLVESAAEITGPLAAGIGRSEPGSEFELSPAELDQRAAWLLEAGPVCVLTGNEFPKSPVDLITQVELFFKGMGGTVTRPGIGIINLDRAGIKSSIAHGLSREKSIAFAAVPGIIQQGKIIDRHMKWKGRAYDTCVIDAPIEIGGEEYMAEVIVNHYQDNTNGYYLHEVEKKSKLCGVFKTGTEPSTPEGASKLIIAKKLAQVKKTPPKNPPADPLAAEIGRPEPGSEFELSPAELDQRNTNGYYLHEVEKKSKLRGVFKTGLITSTPEGASKLIISKKLAEVKENPKKNSPAGLLAAEIAKYRTVGLCAGASTPDSDIAGIEAALTAL